MKQNKFAILIFSPLTVAALVIAWILDSIEITFLSNVLLGVFGSGLLTVFVSIINYWTERERALNSFWEFGHKAICNLNRYSANDDLDTAVDILLQMNEFDYQPFDDAFGELHFIFHNNKLHKEIYKRIYYPILEVRNLIAEKSYHFKIYKKAANGNRAVMKEFVTEIDKLLIKRSESIRVLDDGEKHPNKCVETYKVHRLKCEFNDFFYKIMYPLKKVEEVDNAY